MIANGDSTVTVCAVGLEGLDSHFTVTVAINQKLWNNDHRETAAHLGIMRNSLDQMSAVINRGA